MKQLILALLALGAMSCQQSQPSARIEVNKLSNPAAPAKSQPTAIASSPKVNSLSLALLRKYDLGPLLQTVHPTGDSTMQNHAQNGFFGPTHHRIEVVITGARRDSKQPECYYLAGKTRYRGIIMPFEGMLTIRQLLNQPRWSKRELAYDHSSHDYNHDARYTALGNFVLREDSLRKNSGIFRGKVAIDWGLDSDGNNPGQVSRTDHTLTERGGIKYEGNWTQYGTTNAKEVVWVDDMYGYGQVQHLLENFMIFKFGERDPEINPKYAKLGWNTYWENDEWWADSPKPALGL